MRTVSLSLSLSYLPYTYNINKLVCCRYRMASDRAGGGSANGASSSGSQLHHGGATGTETASSPKKTKSSDKSASKGAKGKSKDRLWTEGVCPSSVPPLEAYLTSTTLPPTAQVTQHDPSSDVLALLRLLHAFNRHWSTMYEVRTYAPLYSYSYQYVLSARDCCLSGEIIPM